MQAENQNSTLSMGFVKNVDIEGNKMVIIYSRYIIQCWILKSLGVEALYF